LRSEFLLPPRAPRTRRNRRAYLACSTANKEVGPPTRIDGGRIVAREQTKRAWGKSVLPSASSASSAVKVFGTRGLLIAAAFVLLSGCRQDMHDQPKYIPLRQATFFGDNRSARPLVSGTVARGQLNDDALLYTGKENGAHATRFPFPIDAKVMARGQERFNIYCSPCHGRAGLGDGMVVRRGYRHPPAFDIDRLRDAPVGHFFDVMTNGFGAMPDYAAQVRAVDRWAIAAYIRALQLSGHATLAEVPAAARGKLQ
jgi:Cytochrome C oxidase, cbb3-type, subunit III